MMGIDRGQEDVLLKELLPVDRLTRRARELARWLVNRRTRNNEKYAR